MKCTVAHMLRCLAFLAKRCDADFFYPDSFAYQFSRGDMQLVLPFFSELEDTEICLKVALSRWTRLEGFARVGARFVGDKSDAFVSTGNDPLGVC